MENDWTWNDTSRVVGNLFKNSVRALTPVYLHLREAFTGAATSGWRLVFCWGMGIALVWAFKAAFVDAVYEAQAMPEYYYNALNIAFVTMLGALGLRGVEKVAAKVIENRNVGVGQ